PAKPAVGAAGAAPSCSWTGGASAPPSGATGVSSSVLSSLITQRLLSDRGQHSSAPMAASLDCEQFQARLAGPYHPPAPRSGATFEVRPAGWAELRPPRQTSFPT